MKTKELCIYHGNCPDGFGSAYIFWDFFRKYEETTDLVFYAANYQEEPPWDLIDQASLVYIVDFSYPLEVCKSIVRRGTSVIIIDHHKTVAEDFGDMREWEDPDNRKYLTLHYDVEKSGVGNVWHYFYSNSNLPIPLMYIQDRDLWQWKYSDSKKFLKGWDLLPFEFTAWQTEMHDNNALSKRVAMGETILQYENKQMDYLIERIQWMSIGGPKDVAQINCPYWLSSDLGNKIMHECDAAFAMLWSRDDKEDAYNYGLRSDDNNIDVSEIAKLFGGGGHRNASGFRSDHGPETIRDMLYNHCTGTEILGL